MPLPAARLAQGGRTTVVIAHRLSTIIDADNIAGGCRCWLSCARCCHYPTHIFCSAAPDCNNDWTLCFPSLSCSGAQRQGGGGGHARSADADAGYVHGLAGRASALPCLQCLTMCTCCKSRQLDMLNSNHLHTHILPLGRRLLPRPGGAPAAGGGGRRVGPALQVWRQVAGCHAAGEGRVGAGRRRAWQPPAVPCRHTTTVACGLFDSGRLRCFSHAPCSLSLSFCACVPQAQAKKKKPQLRQSGAPRCSAAASWHLGACASMSSALHCWSTSTQLVHSWWLRVPPPPIACSHEAHLGAAQRHPHRHRQPAEGAAGGWWG